MSDDEARRAAEKVRDELLAASANDPPFTEAELRWAREQVRAAELERERDEQKALATEALVGNVKLRGACERLRDEQAQAEAQAAALRRALERLRSAATDSANIREHDGWHRTDPYIEMPKEVLAEVDAALEVDAGRVLVARLERYERALREIRDETHRTGSSWSELARAALAIEEEGRHGAL